MTLPAWTALTAYGVTGRITKATPDGTVWWAQVAGTSGAAEPTWPTADPWTVVDGTVTWGRASVARASMVAGLLQSLDTFRDANPKLLTAISASRPKSLTNMSMPGVYIADRDETIAIGASLRTRTFSGLAIVAVDVTPDNAESMARMDLLVDGLVDLFTKYYHSASPQSLTQPNAVTGFQPPEEGLYCQLIQLGPSFVTEGVN